MIKRGNYRGCSYDAVTIILSISLHLEAVA